MSYSGDAAEQVVRMSLEGTEVAARITGAAAKEIAIMIYAVLKDQKKTKGKTRLTNMIRSGKELKVFAVQDQNLAKFCKEAKKYGVLYCVLKDRDANDGITDVMVRAEDASKVNRIFERFKLTTVDMASVRSEIERAVESRSDQQQAQEAPTSAPARSKEDVFLDALLTNPTQEEEQRQNPSEARVERSPRSAPSSTTKNEDRHRSSSRGNDPEERGPRPSVRQELKEIKAELEKSRQKRVRGEKPLEHNAPKKKNKYRKER